ncbi:MAG: hypothetical protein QOI12_1681 [Alphaproteobacteria bacterium]|jgi:hypothetical protein|nr:hypothetical protein [Alphaproteobacteria bacterium]
MKPVTTIVCLFITASALLPASTATAALSPALPQAASAPLESVQDRGARRHVAPADRDNGRGAYAHGNSNQSDGWSHWSYSHHPGWPCVSSGDSSTTSAFPSWEVSPNCR